MNIIRTVTGDMSPSALGICYPHEHLLAAPPEPYASEDPDLILDSEEVAIQELRFFTQAGGQSLVEMTPPDYNRTAPGLRRISEKSGVTILCVTGHLKDKFCAKYVEKQSVEQLADSFIKEIEIGINDTGIRAGVIKASSSLNKITENEEKVFRAAAIAHRQTGALISTHTQAGTMGIEQIELLQSEGVHPSRILIGHVDRLLKWEYLLAIARKGAYMGFDQISKEKYFPDRLRIELIQKLIQEGFQKQLLLSMDLARKSYFPCYQTGGGPGFTYLLWRFIPWLRSTGIPENAIEDMLIHNPARALTLHTT